LWATLKATIDSIVGGDALIVSPASSDVWQLISDDSLWGLNYSTLKSVTTETYGMALSSSEALGAVGNIYIDVNYSGTVSAATWLLLYNELLDLELAYFILHLGYLVAGIYTQEFQI
jgi:hypothetical protein